MFHKIFNRKNFKKALIFLTSYYLNKNKNKKNKNKLGNLNCEILISHCKDHDTVIIFFEISGYRLTHVRILSEKFYGR